MDFQAPSLHTLFGISPRDKYVNDFLCEEATWEEVFVELGDEKKMEGLLVIGFANPDIGEIKKILAKDRKWHMQAISQLLVLKKKLQDEGFDFLIMDSAPGVHYSSINTVVASDTTILVAKMDNFDFDGTIALLDDLLAPLNKPTFILFNKVVEMLLTDQQRAVDIAKSIFQDKSEIIGFVPCYCSVPLGMGSEILALTKPDMPFVRELNEISKILAR